MRLRFRFWSSLLSLASVATSLYAEPSAEQAEAVIQRAQLSAGDLSRLTKVFAKAERGEKIVIGVIGGSITQGARAAKPENRYGNRLAQWWREQFPKAEVTFVNAGIGATNSNYGSLRVTRDLLSKEPDFVVAEYACNDPDAASCAPTYEGLVRQILKAPSQPAVLLLFMTRRDGSNAQQWHVQVGKHYHLPMVSLRDGLWPDIQAGKMTMDDFLADEVHPNDFGHRLTAQSVERALENARKAPVSAEPAAALPAPLFSADYEFTALQEAGDLAPSANRGWTFLPKEKAWHSEEPGSVIEWDVKGRTVMLMSHVIRGAMGRARVQVDEAPPKTIDGWFALTWGGYRMTTLIADGLDPEKTHHVRVELLSEKHPDSTGNGFSIFGLGEAGVR